MVCKDSLGNGWYPAYEDLLELMESWPYKSGDLLHGSGKYPLQFFRYGHGAERIVFICRIHGHEPAGTSGAIAFLKTLAPDKVDFSGFDAKYTIDVIPMVNVDAAVRYARQVPDSYPGNRFKENEEDYSEYKNILTSPGREMFSNPEMRVHHLDKTTLKEMQKKHILPGTVYSEEGIELARDWPEQKSKHIKALLQFLQQEKTDYFIDIHCHEKPTEIYVPFTEKPDSKLNALKKCGEKLIELLRGKNIPCTCKRECGYYEYVRNISNDYIYSRFGIGSFLWEINVGYKLPPSFRKVLKDDYEPRSLSKNEMTRTVYELMSGFMSLTAGT
ncbi:MAG: M14 family zinc carboxypeptidase [Victivallaceae bacterium]|nr:M14 family zinc carboxypeptidase [Victivallaceae bacterium]